MFIGRTTAAKNKIAQFTHDLKKEANQPVDEQDRIAYGIIEEVNEETSQVKVRRLKADGQIGDLLSESFMPLLTPVSVIHMQYGLLRKGLVCRIYWKGRLSPREAIIEVIGDENHTFLNQPPVPNEVTIGPYKIFTGAGKGGTGSSGLNLGG